MLTPAESFLKDQKLEIKDDGQIVLTNTFNTDDLEAQLAEERKEKQTGKNLRKLASIPQFEFDNDPMLRNYLALCELGDAEGARKIMRQFLALNPQYKATTAKF